MLQKTLQFFLYYEATCVLISIVHLLCCLVAKLRICYIDLTMPSFPTPFLTPFPKPHIPDIVNSIYCSEKYTWADGEMEFKCSISSEPVYLVSLNHSSNLIINRNKCSLCKKCLDVSLYRQNTLSDKLVRDTNSEMTSLWIRIFPENQPIV